MSKVKTHAEAKESKAPASTLQKQPETPEKMTGPSLAGTSTTAAMPPPNGKPSAARAADLMTAPEAGSGALGRARIMTAMQGSVGNARLSRMLGATVQTKLTVGAPNDVYEQEANRVAEQVMRAPAETDKKTSFKATPARLQRCPACQKQVQRQERSEGGLCPECRQRLQDEGTLQRQPAGSSLPPVTPETESYLQSTKGGGQPLPQGTRSAAESSLDRDLGDVRVHDSAAANQAAKSLNARAFTHGSDVYLAANESVSDRRLMGHELTHVVQQGHADTGFVRRDPKDPESTPAGETSEERLPDGPPDEGITGPLPEGTRIAGSDWELIQFSRDEMVLYVGASQLSIVGGGAERTYGYHLEPRRAPTQQVVRIVRTSGIDVYQNIVSEDLISLVVHEREVGVPALAEGAYAKQEFGVLELMSGDGVTLNLDDSFIKISVPEQAPGFLPEDFPEAKFAYFIEPEWSGEKGKEKVVHIVATPGVVIDSGTYDLGRELGSSFIEAFVASGYGRVLVPRFVRIQNPDQVPEQGTPFNVEDFLGYRSYVDEDFMFAGITGQRGESPIGVYTGSLGVTVRHEWSGAMLTLRPTNPDVGARFAYEVVPPSLEYPGEIRVVVGPGVYVELVEPVPRRARSEFGPTPTPRPGEFEPGEALREERVDIQIVEIPYPAQVPRQGSPINLEYYYSIGGSSREPDKHEYLETSDLPELVATTAVDVGIGMIPIVGDIADIGEFFLAIFTDKDRWGREVTTTDKVLMGFGALIGLIPFVGGAGSLLRKGGKAVVKIADFAKKTGKSVEQLEVILIQLRRAASPADQAAILRAEAALRASGEISADDLKVINRLSKDLGGPVPRISPGGLFGDLPPGAADELLGSSLRRADEATDWRRGLSPETRYLLAQNPSLARKFEEMPARVRRIFTKCGSDCLPTNPPPTARQIERVDALTKGIEADDLQRLRAYFYDRRRDLEAAISALERAGKRRGGLTRFIRSEVDDVDAVLLPRPGWRNDEAMRAQVAALLGSGDISVDRFAAIMRGAASTGTGGPRTVDYVTQLLRRKPQGYGQVLGELAAGHNFFRGAEWVLRYIDRRGLWDLVDAFEVTAEIGGRRWDASITGILYEFKNWGNFYGSSFVSQVVRDYNRTDGFTTPLRWVFEPRIGEEAAVRAAARQALTDAMRREATAPGLSAREVREIMERYDEIIHRIDGIIFVPSREMVSLR